MRATPAILPLTLLALACGGPPAPVDDDHGASQAVFALVHSPPNRWAPCVEAVLANGQAAIRPLLRELETSPHGPGAQPAVAVLGRLAGACPPGEDTTAAAARLLRELLGHASADVAAEAALSLARMRAPDAHAALRASMLDPAASTYARTAAASALVDLGDRGDAVAFLCDILLAPTDRGRARAATRGLPVDQARWAVERNLAIDAIGRAAPGTSFRLDADASWPSLEAGVAEVREHFRLEPR